MVDLPKHGSQHKTVRQWMFAICLENPVIQRKGEFKWKRSSRWNVFRKKLDLPE